MKSILVATALLFSLPALAETADLTVKGMHCHGCMKLVSKMICDNKDVKAFAETCEITLAETDAKKQAKNQIGHIKIVSKANTKIDMEKVKTQLKAADEDYKIIAETVQ